MEKITVIIKGFILFVCLYISNIVQAQQTINVALNTPSVLATCSTVEYSIESPTQTPFPATTLTITATIVPPISNCGGGTHLN